MFDLLIVFLKEYFENVIFEKISRRQKVKKKLPRVKCSSETHDLDVFVMNN